MQSEIKTRLKCCVCDSDKVTFKTKNVQDVQKIDIDKGIKKLAEDSTSLYGQFFIVYDNGKFNIFIWVNSSEQDKSGKVATLSHEIFHGITYIAKQIDAPIDYENSEVWAYYMKWLVKEFHELL